jgi:hypothetical protein
VKQCLILQECGGEIGVGVLLRRFRRSNPKDFCPNQWDDVWARTADGQHCWVRKQLHPIWFQDPQYFSHKYGKAGLNYELAISLFKSQVVSMAEKFSLRKVFSRTYWLAA